MALDDERPVRVAVELGNITAAAARQLICEHAHKDRRTAVQRQNVCRRARRLSPHREHRRPGRFRHEQECVAPDQASERTEFIAGDEHEARADAAARELGERPPGRIRLVGQADLDVTDKSD